MPRVRSRDILPTAVKTRAVDNQFIKNTTVEQEDAVTLNNGLQLNITSTIASTINAGIRVGMLPFMIAIFQDSLTAANHIPYGSNVDGNIYQLVGPIAVPALTSIGTDGNNVVMKTSLYNGTGSNQSIIVVTQARYITGIGGGSST